MSSLKKIVLAMLPLGIVALGSAPSGYSSSENKNPETLNQQDKDSVATIDRQEANGDITSPEATMEKDSVKRDHILKF